MKIFDDYVNNFDMNLDGIYLKYYHSYRVQDIACNIAKSLDYNEKDYNLVSICGLFHDIGRFEQFQKYQSFDDHKTIDHGDLGYEILKQGMINELGLDDEEKEILLMSTKYHNKYAVDKDIKGRMLDICNVIRDADKIDIINLFSSKVISKGLLEGDLNVSEKCHEEFMNHKQIVWTDVKTNADRILVYLGFIWDFNYRESFKILKERKLYTEIKDIVKLPSFDKYFQMIDEKIKEELK
jgi:putative nucleotidyltransferase with HDIG domain